MFCVKCGKEFFEDWRKDRQIKKNSPKYCSRKCANSHFQTPEMNEARRLKLQKREKKYCSCGEKISWNNKSGVCKKCKIINKKTNTKRVIEWRRRKKLILVEYKGGKCQICGYNKSLEALQFHHLNPEEKDFALSQKNIKSIEKSKKEADKCILVCANCHAEIHAGIVII